MEEESVLLCARVCKAGSEKMRSVVRARRARDGASAARRAAAWRLIFKENRVRKKMTNYMEIRKKRWRGVGRAGRDLNFLVRSYIGNLVLALTALALTQRAQLGILGVWWVLVQFQTTRLVWNTLRLRNSSSPLRATQPLPALAH